MINTKELLSFYLDADKFMLGYAKHKMRPSFFDHIWKFQIHLRKTEYYSYKKNFIYKMLYLFHKFRLKQLSYLLGFDIPIGVFGPGLRINHYGNIVVSKFARIGPFCDIHQGVNIGALKDSDGNLFAPKIGSNVWIAPGVKIYGDVCIDNQICIGANAVVGKSFSGPCTIGGIPAKEISKKGSLDYNIAANPSRAEMFYEMYPQWKKYYKREQ